MKKLHGAGGALSLVLAGLLGTASGCGSDSNDTGGGGLKGTTRFAVSSTVSNNDSNAAGYVTILDSLEPRAKLSLKNAREFVGQSDMWTYEGAVFVASGDEPKVTKFTVGDDGRLVQQGQALSFAAYGFQPGDAAFWYNRFISPTKAYMIHGTAEYVVWNPAEMKIIDKFNLPKMEPRDGMIPRAAFMDRGTVVHNGRLYQPLYWTDEGWERRPDDSKIAVFDVNTNQLIQLLSAPCPGLDVATLDESGNIYFSPWTGGAAVHLVLENAATCVAKVDTNTLKVSVEFNFKDVTEGREGSAFYYAGKGQFVMSVFHHEKVDVAGAKKPFDIIHGLNWHIWSYDPKSHKATEVSSIGWNSGATYWTRVDGAPYALIPGANYASTIVYGFNTADSTATKLFDTDGWMTRLFKVR
ncbi:hypothetical protein [Pendulispora albinea]|uniref:Uncharacterized protein n=1 Tax=Pendulispora albinea TaxID=2741071 RepID=A0ABZ2LYR8_9BACT